MNLKNSQRIDTFVLELMLLVFEAPRSAQIGEKKRKKGKVCVFATEDFLFVRYPLKQAKKEKKVFSFRTLLQSEIEQAEKVCVK